MSTTSHNNNTSRASGSYNDEMNTFLPNLPGFRQKRAVTPFRYSSCELLNGIGFINTDKNAGVPTLQEASMIGGSSILTKTKSIENQGINLTFTGYFEEFPVHLKSGQRQIRKVKIFYFLEDDTMKITERPQVNSGTVQGTIVRRSVIFKEDGLPFTQFDLQIGSKIKVLSQDYTICDAEPATRNYLTSMGFDDIKAIPIPEDCYQKFRLSLQSEKADLDKDWARFHSKKNETKAFSDAKMGVLVDNSNREGFMKYGKQTLNFKCIWDNTSQLYGDCVDLTLNYYLSDDTIQVMTVPEKFSMGTSKLMKRGKLPKDLDKAMLLGLRMQAHEYIRYSDLHIGMKLNIFGRILELCDADFQTRKFYEARGMPLGRPVVKYVPLVTRPVREIPPSTGFGSEEDSMRSVNGSIMPGPVPAKKLGENRIISFLAALSSGGIDDVDRRFVVTYYIQDNTLKIAEPQMRNSGFSGGLFLSRREVKNKDGSLMKFHDLYIGRDLSVLNHRFKLLDANSATMKWFEDQGLPRSSYYKVLEKIRPFILEDVKNGVLKKAFEDKETPEAPGLATLDTLRKVLTKYPLLGNNEADLSEHELRTILRGAGNPRKTFNYLKFLEQVEKPTDEFK